MKSQLCQDEGCPQQPFKHVCINDVVAIDSYEPDYESKCCNCDQSPAVTGVKNGKVVYHSDMCGPCTFGEAACLDPKEWNK